MQSVQEQRLCSKLFKTSATKTRKAERVKLVQQNVANLQAVRVSASDEVRGVTKPVLVAFARGPMRSYNVDPGTDSVE